MGDKMVQGVYMDYYEKVKVRLAFLRPSCFECLRKEKQYLRMWSGALPLLYFAPRACLGPGAFPPRKRKLGKRSTHNARSCACGRELYHFFILHRVPVWVPGLFLRGSGSSDSGLHITRGPAHVVGSSTTSLFCTACLFGSRGFSSAEAEARTAV